MDFKIIHIEETDSTNHWLKEHGEGNMVVVADYQTAGRGCGSNSWESERGRNLTFSMLIHPENILAKEQFRITEVVSVAMCRMLQSYIYNKVEIKWPNDIYVGDKKICGILIENRLQGTEIKDSIIGIGLNVNQKEFKSDAPNPVSLYQLTGQETDLEEMLMAFLDCFDSELKSKTTCFTYREMLFRRGKDSLYRSKTTCFTARLTDVLPDGRLLLVDQRAENVLTPLRKYNSLYNIIRYMARFKRILLKLSGESLMGKQGYGIDPERLSDYAKQIKEVSEMGVQIGIVIGGGNIFRGLSGSQKGFDRVKGDQMGMCATVINSLALSSALGAIGVKNRVMTAIRMEPIGEFYTKWKAIEAMEQGDVCIFSAGTGSPYFTTDTGSSLRGIEIEADVMLKGTRVDGVYTADPEKDPTATKFEDITYQEVLERGLKVMDLTAICMCNDNHLPIYVFNMDIVGNLKKVMDGDQIGTLVHS